MNSAPLAPRPVVALACIQVLAATVMALIPPTSTAEQAVTLEGFLASMYASADTCRPSMPNEVALGLEEVRARFRGLDIATIQNTQAYKDAYQEEAGQLRSLGEKDRQSGCEWDWGNYRGHKTGKQAARKDQADGKGTPEANLGAMYASAAVCQEILPEQAGEALARWPEEYARLGGNVQVSQQSEPYKKSYKRAHDDLSKRLREVGPEALRFECATLLR